MGRILRVEWPQGGGVGCAFGGAGGGGTDAVFGGRVGDALTIMTVVAFILFLGLAVALSLVESKIEPVDTTQAQPGIVTTDTTPSSTGITPAPSPTEPTDSESDHPTSTPDHPTGDN